MSIFFKGLLIVGGVIIGIAAAILIAFAVAKIMVWIDEREMMRSEYGEDSK